VTLLAAGTTVLGDRLGGLSTTTTTPAQRDPEFLDRTPSAKQVVPVRLFYSRVHIDIVYGHVVSEDAHSAILRMLTKRREEEDDSLGPRPS